MPQAVAPTPFRVGQKSRRALLLSVSAAALLASLGGGLALPGEARAADAPVKEIRVGFQKYGTLVILKARGSLEKRLAAQGISVKWVEFPFGPPLLEAINVGGIDIGTTGEAPPVFAQAAGTDLVYVGNEPPAPRAEALLVPKDSPLKTLADLKGRKIAVAKGSNAHFLLVKLLEKAGIKYTDIQPIYLAPADARAAFESGRVDAWSVWDPYAAATEKQIGARVLADGTGVVANHQFYLAARSFAEQHPDLVHAVLEELDKVDQWGKQNPKEVAAFLAPQIGVDLPVVELATSRYAFGVQPVSDDILAAQQKVADAFFELKLIPKAIKVSDAAWRPKK